MIPSIKSVLSVVGAVVFSITPMEAWGQQQPASGKGPSGGKELVAVMELSGVDARKPELAALSEELRARLLQSGKFRVVERQQIDAILQEQAFQQTGCTSQECAVQVGKVLGVRGIITGRVTKINDSLWQIAVQMVDTESAETLRAVTVNQSGPFSALLTEGVANLTAKLVGQPEGMGAISAAQPATPLPPTGPLKGEHIRRVLTGNTLSGTRPDNVFVKLTFHADGSAEQMIGATTQKGNWKIEGDKYCLSFPAVGAGQWNCFSMARVDRRKFQVITPSGIPVELIASRRPEASETDIKPRLAVLPVFKTGSWKNADDWELGWITRAIVTSAQSSGLEVSHSVHITKDKNPVMAGANIGNLKDVTSDAWSIIGTPNIDFGLKKGRDLGVDAVIFLFIRTGATASSGDFTLNIVDVVSGKTIKETRQWPYKDGYINVRDELKKAFSKYKREF